VKFDLSHYGKNTHRGCLRTEIIFGPKKDEVTGDSRQLHGEELHKLYSSSVTFIMIKSRQMR
jgi:hypothetical protein